MAEMEAVFNDVGYWKERAFKAENIREELRDQMAMAALTGLVSVLAHQTNWHSGTAETMAGSAYGIADAMLKVKEATSER